MARATDGYSYERDRVSGKIVVRGRDGRVLRRPEDFPSFQAGPVVGPLPIPTVESQTGITDVTRAAARQIAGDVIGTPVVPFKPKKKASPKKSAPAGAGGTGGGTVAGTAAPTPVATPQPMATTSDGDYEWFHPESYYYEQARAGLQGDIDSSRAQYDRQQAALRAQQEGAARLLADFGKSVSGYYADAATKAGQGYDTQAAAQALLGALGQRAFTGQGAGSIASDLAAAGNGQLGQALASQETNRNATVGAILNRIVGTDKASEFLTASRNATKAALSNSASQNAYGQRLLAGLTNTQQTAMNELLGKRADFEAKIPGVVAKRAQEMSAAAAKQMMLAKAFDLDVRKQDDLTAYRNSQLGITQQRLEQQYTAKNDKLRTTKIGDLSKDIAQWAEGKQQTSLSTGETYVTRPPLTYQEAFKKARTTYGAFLPESDIIALLNTAYPVRGQNGRPYLSKVERDRLVNEFGYQRKDVDAATWDGAKATVFLPELTG